MYTGSLFSQMQGDILIQKADSLKHVDADEAITLAIKAMDHFGEEGSVFVNAATILSEVHRGQGNVDSAIYYSTMGIPRAMEIRDTVSTIFFYINRGSDYYLKAEYSKAMSDYINARELYNAFGYKTETEKISPLNYAKLLNNIGTAHIKTGRYDSSLVYFIKSIKIKEQNDAPLGMLIVSKINIGSIYLAIKDYENSEVWILQALNDAANEKDTTNMARCFANLGILYKKTGDTIKAIEYYKKGISINESRGDYRNLSIVLQNLALLYTSQNKFDEAYVYFSRALANNNKMQANNCRLHLAISRMFVEQQKYDSAISHSYRAIQPAEESGNVDVQIENYELLYKAFKGKGRYLEALKYFEKHFALKDSISDQENQEYIQKLKTEFETERKEKEIELLKKLNESESLKAEAIQSEQRLIIIITLLVLTLLTVLSISYFLKKKRQRKLYLVEKRLLETNLQKEELVSKELQVENTFKTKQLTTHTLNMMQQNQILNDIEMKLEKLSNRIDASLTIEFKSILRDIKQSHKTEKDWELFKNYFENINKDFYTKLRNINPKLSVHDYRLAALISLNLNIKESAALLNISPNSVKTSRYRLRKRLGLDNSEDLYVFLNRL